MQTSYGVFWIEIVVAVVAAMCLAFVVGETAAFIRVRRLRQRDGGVPLPRTRDEYLLLFPRACPRCLSREGKQVKGWHLDQLAASRFVDAWQCAACGYIEGGESLSPMRDTEITERPVRARQRWFISTAEAERIEPPRPGFRDVRTQDEVRAGADDQA